MVTGLWDYSSQECIQVERIYELQCWTNTARGQLTGFNSC